jgi:N-acetylmuramoyl-L-alanine amidase
MPEESLTKDKPLKGEGIYSFLKRHQLSYSEYRQEFIELNEGKFGKDHSLLSHHAYILPQRPHYLNILFGPNYEHVVPQSNELQGAVIYLVNGHGGPDPGAIGTYQKKKMYEDEYAYDISLRLARNLMEHGAKVHLIIQDPDDGIRDDRFLSYDNHETCMNDPIPLDQMERLKQRAEKVNTLYKKDTEAYRRCLILHLDSRSRRKQIDVFFYHHQGSSQGALLAKTLRQTFENNYKKHQPYRGFSGTVSDRNLYMLRMTTPVSVFIELGNIQNYRDQQRFILENNRQALANWLFEGIKKDFNRINKNK